MRERITTKQLQAMTDRLNAILGRPTADEIGHLLLDYAPSYGGYAIRERGPSMSESFYWPRWERVSAREMYAYLEAALTSAEVTRCHCDKPETVIFGRFNPPAYVCQNCGRNLTKWEPPK